MASKPKLLDYLGRPVELGALTEELATSNLIGVRTPWHPSVANSVTPERLAAILLAVDQNDILEYLTLAEEMEERDLHYSSVLHTRKLAVSGLKVTVEAHTDAADDVEMADQLQDILCSDEGTTLISDLMDAVGKGYSVCEIMWDRSTSQWEPECFKWRDPRYFQFDNETYNVLRMRDMSEPTNGLELKPYKFIQHRPRIKTGLTIRGGLARLAVVAFMCKSYTIKDWLAFIEVYGMPIRVGKYDAQATPAQKSELLRAVSMIGTDAACIIPDTMIIEFEEASRGTTGDTLFQGMADWWDKQVSKGVLGQTMTTDDGSSQSQANVHNDVRGDIQDDDAKKIAATISRDFIRPFVDLNYGPRPRREYPRVCISEEESEDLKLLSEALPPFINLGMRVEVAEIRDKFKLRKPEAGAEVLEPAMQPQDLQQDPSAPKKPKSVKDQNNYADAMREAQVALLHRVSKGEELTADQRLLVAQLMGATPDQDETDRLAQEAMGEWRKVMEPILDPLIQLSQEASSYEDLLARLDASELDADALIRAVATLTFQARGLGSATDKVRGV